MLTKILSLPNKDALGEEGFTQAMPKIEILWKEKNTNENDFFMFGFTVKNIKESQI